MNASLTSSMSLGSQRPRKSERLSQSKLARHVISTNESLKREFGANFEKRPRFARNQHGDLHQGDDKMAWKKRDLSGIKNTKICCPRCNAEAPSKTTFARWADIFGHRCHHGAPCPSFSPVKKASLSCALCEIERKKQSEAQQVAV